ncbi:MAG: M48 family metallopeptidase [Pirellulales bacterium]
MNGPCISAIEFVRGFVAIALMGLAYPCFAQNPAESFQKMFEQFSSQANQFAPGMLGEMSPEQKAKLASIKVSVQEEQQAGQKAMDAFLEYATKQKWKVVADGKEVRYLKQLLKVLTPKMKHEDRYGQWDVRIVEMDGADAYSFAGGHLLFTKGLMETVGSEAALVGVIAHELSHLDREHLLLPLKQAKMMNQPLTGLDGFSMMALFARPFRPENESEADRDAVEWMMAAGYEPKELSRMLNQWDAKQSQTAPWMDFVPGFVKTHPDPGRRANRECWK